MKYIFLDVDGVLNHEQWYEDLHENPDAPAFPYSCFDPQCVARVNEILEATGAQLVISSSWRLDKQLYLTLNSIGLKSKFECTPIFKKSNSGLENFDCRGSEIREFLLAHKYNPETDNYVIVDDDSDMLDEQLPHFFQTAGDYWSKTMPLVEKNGGTGLTETLKNRIISFLIHGK